MTLRLVFRVPLRQAEGFLRSVLSLMGVDLAAPDHTTLSRRSQSLAVECRRIPSRGPIHLIVDSTGLSLVGEGEWAAVKHGGRGHRGWKTLHLAVDRVGVIVAHALTEPTVDAATIGIDLIETVDVVREPLHGLTAQRLLARCAALRPGRLDTPTASAKYTLRALARRWFALAEEIATHDRHLARLTTETSPTLRAGFGVGANSAAEFLIVFGDNPERIRSEAAFAKRCGACPIPASSGRTTGRHRLYRGGHRQANAALYRSVIVRMRYHQPTVDYVVRRTADDRTKREIIRCLKRFLAREIYQRVMTDFRARRDVAHAA